VPVVPVDCAGFYGTKNLGNRIAGEAMFKYVIGTASRTGARAAQRPGIRVHDVNLIGEYNIAGEFWHVAPLFDELGLRILCTLSGDARFHEVQTMHRAQASMVVCAKALLNVARKLEVDFGVPFFEGSFYGITDTSQAFRDFARLLGDADLAARTEAHDRPRGSRIRAALEPWRATPGRQARAALHRRRQELVGGFRLAGSGHDGGRHRHQQIDRGRQGAHPRAHGRRDQDDHRRQPQGAAAGLPDYQADILIAGGRNLYTALKARIPFLDINQEREFGYAGYDGMLELVRQLALTLESPVWRKVRTPAPWAQVPGEMLLAVGEQHG
jgi:nitrogenase molybdenum-cofactor synthesis protein NifE